MTERAVYPVLAWFGGAVLAAALFATQVAAYWPAGGAEGLGLDRIILTQSVLPRAAVALLAGATLGLSGFLLQRVLRNPLAEPSTLGISAGAQLAMAVAALHAPAAMEYSVATVAFLGGVAAVALVLALTWRRGLEPVSVVLAGMMIALIANAASATLILANGEYLFSLFIWGGGSLVQQSWGPSLSIGVRLLIGIGAAVLLLRPLALLGLDDEAARSLGIATHAGRLLIVALAVWMATTVVAEVGVIGFVGLAAPALAALSGARSPRQRLIAAPLIGAVLLWLTDGLVQFLSGPGGERIPTGAATALLGGPLLIWLLPRLRMFEWPSFKAAATAAPRAMHPWRLSVWIAVCVCLAMVAALLLGKGQDGWTIAGGDLLRPLLDLRAPRLIVAACAGAMLGAAGVIIQRISGNPLASPEILGVGTAAGAGLAAILLIAPQASLAGHLAGSTIGALFALVAILALAARGGLGPERLLFAGIAVNALCSSVLTAVIALGNQQSYMLLRWLSGSTSSVTMLDGWIAIAGLVVLTAPLLLAARWLDIFPLGATTAQALGVDVRCARFMLILAAALLTALAAQFVGPLSFIGLIGPHLARLLGLTRASQHLIGSALLGALLMIVSDWLGRMAAFPYQLPVGLFASLLGGPYLIYLLAKGVPRNV